MGEREQVPYCRLPPPRCLLPAEDEVDVWRADLYGIPATPEQLSATLAPDERALAARIRFPRDRQRFVASRAALRDILASYVGLEPGELAFVYGRFGKPALAPECGAGELRFNLACSHGLALYAVARRRAVGIDVERIQPHLVEEHLAERFFSAAEVSALRALPENSQTEAFFNCWTRKEAYLKALGTGLLTPLDSFAVSVDPGEPAALLEGTEPGWGLQALAPADGYAAAVVAEGHGWQAKLRQWMWQETEKRFQVRGGREQ